MFRFLKKKRIDPLVNGSDSQSGVESWKPVGASFFVKKKSGLDNGVSIMGLSLCMESIGTRSSRLEAGGWAEKKCIIRPLCHPPKKRYLPLLSIGLMKPLLQMQLDGSLKGGGVRWAGRRRSGRQLSIVGACDAPTDCDNVPHRLPVAV